MMSEVFGLRTQRRTERTTFRPVLESLERRDVPSAATISAAFHALPTDVANLQASLTARDATGVSNNLATVNNDVFLLKNGASAFVPSNRLQIDAALFSNGLTLIFNGFSAFPGNSEATAFSVIAVGEVAVEAGALDFVFTSFFPQTSGDAVLT